MEMTRRAMLHVGALGVGGLSLPDVLRTEASSGARPKSCILIFAWGGPTQHDTLDMKPDAPAEIRGEFKPIATRVPGIQICELLPRLAAQADQFTIVRSVSHKNSNHNPGAYYALTGHAPVSDGPELTPKRSDWPALGAALARVSPVSRPVPPYVLLPIMTNDIGRPTPGQLGGFLGSGLDPLIVHYDPKQASFAGPALTPRTELTPERLDARRALLAGVNAPALGAWGQAVSPQDLDQHQERAWDLVRSTASKQAFDISKELAAVRERYGRNRVGQSVLLARRLIEAGARLVLVNDANDNGGNGRWDTHSNNFTTLRKNLPETDGYLSALLHDLRERGMLDSTLVVWMGEFGRTPTVARAGARDHWPHCYSLLMAGGGIKGGQVYGSSDARAAYPRDNACKPEDIHATIYHALGLPADTMLSDPLGRPLPLYHSKPIEVLF
ncbi:MAG: DUF1501 domain-containing protein [Planctomycetia bacterium]|nr:DUF1501 domain-containing protein [Planctomycetia bacterium]